MNFIIETKTELTDARVADILTSAFEGGIGYWACIEDVIVPETAKVDPAQHGWLYAGAESYPNYIAAPLIRGSVTLSDQEDDQHAEEHPKLYTVDRAAIERGLNLMASTPEHRHHFVDIIEGDDDANTGDVLIQLAVFGEVRYG